MLKSIIIGGGIAGLAAAIRLRAKGHEVSLFEANSYLGGKLTVIQKDGFRWDAGPSLFTLPHLVDELFECLGENPRDYFTYHRKDTICHYFWEDGTTYQMKGSQREIAEDISIIFGEDQDVVNEYLTRAAIKYDSTKSLFLEKSLHRVETYLSSDTLKALRNTPKLDLFSSLHDVNDKTFSNPKTVQLFDRFATYNGSSPYLTPGIMSMIPHLEMDLGTYLPVGGLHAITESLSQLALRHGVEIKLNHKVEQILIENGKAIGVETMGELVSSDFVVSNMDVFATYNHLIKDQITPSVKRTLQQERSSSALIFYWGIQKEYGQLDLHNILFGNHYKDEFEAIFSDFSIHSDPTIYINITSKFEKRDAPDGCENWFVMINTPADKGQDWDGLIREARKNVVSKIDRVLSTNIEEAIISESILDPRLIASNTQSHQGALYGTASNNRYAAFVRHPNYKNVKNLFFCGGSVHPGGGIPLCLHSSKIVSNLID